MLLLIVLIGFASLVYAQSTVLLNNSRILSSQIGSGDLQHYYFPISSPQGQSLLSEERIYKRAPSNVFLTLTSCSQPTAPDRYEGEVPALNMFISTSSETTLPGPSQGLMVNGTKFGRIAWDNSGKPVEQLWIGVVAPTLTNNWRGVWTYQIAISTEEWMHPIMAETSDRSGGAEKSVSSMELEDTDDSHALFTVHGDSSNATLLMATAVPPELRYSLCAAEQSRAPGYTTNTSQIVDGQRILVSNLTQDTSYMAYLIKSSGAVRSMSAPVNVQTKADYNCRLIYGLDFCDQVAYSVPAGTSDSIDSIRAQYDAQARNLFEPFNVAISQFNCETTQYSLVRNCTDCYNDYKRWLCAVTIPRCTSGSQTQNDVVATRKVDINESRNPWIDETLVPGVWTEILPCIDLCYQVVQSCPPFMAFNCPKGELASLQYGYWKRAAVEINGTSVQLGPGHPTCNRAGLSESRLVLSGALRLQYQSVTFLLGIVICLVLL